MRCLQHPLRSRRESGAYAISRTCSRGIIDNHAHHQVTVRMMQDHAITIMPSKRQDPRPAHQQGHQRQGGGVGPGRQQPHAEDPRAGEGEGTSPRPRSSRTSLRRRKTRSRDYEATIERLERRGQE